MPSLLHHRPEPGIVEVTPPGHAVAVWADRLAEAPTVSLEQLMIMIGARTGSPLLTVGAHPDDETLGLGRLLSLWGRLIGPTSVLVATAGEACLDHLGRRPSGLAQRRLVEWELALDDLGVADRRCLGVDDGHVAQAEDEVADALTEAIRHRTTAAPIVLAAPWRHDPHPDHRAAGRAAARVARQLDVPLIEFPVWMTFWGDPAAAESVGAPIVRVEHDPAADRAHHVACGRFVSQLAPLARDLSPVVPAAMLEHHHQQLIILDASIGATS